MFSYKTTQNSLAALLEDLPSRKGDSQARTTQLNMELRVRKPGKSALRPRGYEHTTLTLNHLLPYEHMFFLEDALQHFGGKATEISFLSEQGTPYLTMHAPSPNTFSNHQLSRQELAADSQLDQYTHFLHKEKPFSACFTGNDTYIKTTVRNDLTLTFGFHTPNRSELINNATIVDELLQAHVPERTQNDWYVHVPETRLSQLVTSVQDYVDRKLTNTKLEF